MSGIQQAKDIHTLSFAFEEKLQANETFVQTEIRNSISKEVEYIVRQCDSCIQDLKSVQRDDLLFSILKVKSKLPAKYLKPSIKTDLSNKEYLSILRQYHEQLSYLVDCLRGEFSVLKHRTQSCERCSKQDLNLIETMLNKVEHTFNFSEKSVMSKIKTKVKEKAKENFVFLQQTVEVLKTMDQNELLLRLLLRLSGAADLNFDCSTSLIS